MPTWTRRRSGGRSPAARSRRPPPRRNPKTMRRWTMPKRIALKDSVLVDGVDLSNLARSARRPSEHERVDVSGFNATGANEYLAGATEQSLVVEFYGSYGPGEVHATLEPIHANREVVP